MTIIIPNWRKSWRLITVQLGALAVLWTALPEQTQLAILDLLKIDRQHLLGVFGLAVIVGRLLYQPKTREEPYQQETILK